MQFSSINDEGIFALNNIPLSKTYGSTVYKKSIDVIYTLRNYLGDSLFFKGCKYYLHNRGDGNATSLDLRDDLSKATEINTNDFFNDWINTKGYPHFSIDSIAKLNDDYFIFTRQRSIGNSHQYKMPIELYFANREKDSIVTIFIDSITNKFHLKISFKPLWFALNHSKKITDAIISDELIINEPRVYFFKETNVKINVNEAGVKPSTLRIELNYIKLVFFLHPIPTFHQ